MDTSRHVGRCWVACVGLMLGIVAVLRAAPPSGEDPALRFTARSQPERDGKFVVNEHPVEWDARETAVVICDMWDKHWCEGASRRGGEIAPRIDALAKAVRA